LGYARAATFNEESGDSAPHRVPAFVLTAPTPSSWGIRWSRRQVKKDLVFVLTKELLSYLNGLIEVELTARNGGATEGEFLPGEVDFHSIGAERGRCHNENEKGTHGQLPGVRQSRRNQRGHGYRVYG
jgi:hypothetical protein